ncbi:MAG: hypothetical protein ACRDQU_14760 [Pseudonocardiaceae bacterium]
MSIMATPHRPWCAESDCYTRQDGLLVHLGTETIFDADRGAVGLRLVDRGDGIEVQVQVSTTIVTATVVVYTELAVELAVELAASLVRHADCAQGHSESPE